MSDMRGYVQAENCTEDDVNQLMVLGYKLHSITPTVEQVTKNGIVVTYKTTLVYHFLKGASR